MWGIRGNPGIDDKKGRNYCTEYEARGLKIRLFLMWILLEHLSVAFGALCWISLYVASDHQNRLKFDLKARVLTPGIETQQIFKHP